MAETQNRTLYFAFFSGCYTWKSCHSDSGRGAGVEITELPE